MAQDERAQWIERLDTARGITLDLVKTLPPEVEVYPGWLLKDFLAHLAGWQEAGITSLRAYCRDEEWQIPTFRGLDEYNEQSVATRKDLRFEQVYAEWQMIHESLKAALLELPPEKLGGNMLLPWARRGPVSAVVDVMVDHEYEHHGALREAKAKIPPAP